MLQNTYHKLNTSKDETSEWELNHEKKQFIGSTFLLSLELMAQLWCALPVDDNLQIHKQKPNMSIIVHHNNNRIT